VGLAERDRRLFEAIRGRDRKSAGAVAFAAQWGGGLISPSTVWPCDDVIQKLDRIPAYPHSESDRLLARPTEAIKLERIRQTRQCWRNWHSSAIYRRVVPPLQLFPANPRRSKAKVVIHERGFSEPLANFPRSRMPAKR
jgi:hypothetical protein